MSNFWDLLWLIASTFVFVAYLLVLFQIITDLFRDTELGGLAKAIWIICLILLPLLTALVYIVSRGTGMAARQRCATFDAHEQEHFRCLLLDRIGEVPWREHDA